MLETIMSINSTVNSIVWGPPMLLLLIGTGILLTVRSGFLIQIRKFGTVMKHTAGSLFGPDAHKKGESGVTPFQAVATALASTVGTGNITGVATAITVGGPGAVFWMWVSAFFGMMTKYAEVLLAVKFREKNELNEWVGGPMYYIEKGLGWKWLAVIFAVFAAVASFGIGNIAQSNSIANAVHQVVGVTPLITGVITAAAVAFVILGGISRIAQVTEKLVPFMGLFYVILGVVTLAMNFENIPEAFKLIFWCAFNPEAAVGGAAGYTMMLAIRYGFARGVFSNEAGLGSAPIAHAAANTDSPVKQAFWGAFEVFFDTFIICSITGLVVVSSGVWTSDLQGTALTIAAFGNSTGAIGEWLITIATILFAFSTILGWSYYGEKAIEYLFKGTSAVGSVKLAYRMAFVVMTVFGAVGSLTLVWDIADTLNGLMAIPNLIGLVGLSGIVVKLTKEHFSKN
ncbi:MAG: alanine:cation symporter family protein [Peptococcaceae bacterium]|nr:alanine:cation symporter family protein [Peptococcaceae bacterium]